MNTDNKNTQTQQSCLTDVKCRFFAQYWGQRVVAHTEDLGIKGIKEVRYEPRTVINFKEIENSCLVLKQLSKITDEDSISVAKIFGMKEDLEFIGKILCTTMFDNSDSETETVLYNSNAKAVDYLRSKGYALPFMEYSVEDLISFGWVRLV